VHAPKCEKKQGIALPHLPSSEDIYPANFFFRMQGEGENMGKGKGGKPSTTGKPSGKGRDNNPPK